VVGLDGIYRLTPGLNLDRAGHPFVDFQIFVLEYDTINNYYYYKLQLNFDGDNGYIVCGLSCKDITI
jgi:hypothetical protein